MARINYIEKPAFYQQRSRSKRLYVRMLGRKIYEYALKNVPVAIKRYHYRRCLSIEDIDKILFIHQANAKMDYAMIERLHRLYDVKEYDHAISPMTIQDIGNTSVATIPTM